MEVSAISTKQQRINLVVYKKRHHIEALAKRKLSSFSRWFIIFYNRSKVVFKHLVFGHGVKTIMNMGAKKDNISKLKVGKIYKLPYPHIDSETYLLVLYVSNEKHGTGVVIFNNLSDRNMQTYRIGDIVERFVFWLIWNHSSPDELEIV